jgi:hypothetical protein
MYLLLFRHCPFHRITHNLADVGVEEDGIGLVAWLEVENLAPADLPSESLPRPFSIDD